jgi:spore germination protein GerM
MKHQQLTGLFLSGLLILALLVAGCTTAEKTDDPNNAQPPITGEQTELTLYFAEEGAAGLVAEQRMAETENPEELPSLVVQELIAGPNDSSLYPTIPPETRLLSLIVEEGTAMVDFSQDIISKHWGGSAGETITLMSLVNSLTELSNIERVQILVEGEKVDSLLGHWDTSQPLERNESYILPADS